MTDSTPLLQANLQRMRSALSEWLIKEGLLGDAEFYSVEAWRERGEPYHLDSLLVLTIDGSSLHTMLNFGGDTAEFDDLVESFGFWYELGHSWNMGFYASDGYDFSPSTGAYTQKLSDPRWQQKADAVRRRAGHVCQDCGAKERLDAHHCYYANMREGYEPWEYPLSAFRALCRSCHTARGKAEIRMRAFAASLTRTEIESLRPSLDHAMYWYKPSAVFEFLSALGPEDRHIQNALEKLLNGRAERDD